MTHTFADLGFPGRLIAVEGLDGSGKSTQIYLLKRWLEMRGLKVFFSEWNSSALVKSATSKGKKQNLLTPTTFSLIHATDFADQLENNILPALRAGSIVIADRYIYTLMVRDLVRGMDEDWLRNLYGIALVPDAVFYLEVRPEILVQRVFAKQQALDYWESGMDLGLSRDMFDSFLQYQSRMRDTFRRLQRRYGFDIIDAERSMDEVNAELRQRIENVLAGDLSRQPTAG
jgi:dTMP kinase